MSRPVRIILVVLVVAAVVAANVVRRHGPVSGVEVNIEYPGSDTLETVSHVEAMLKQQMPELATVRVKDVRTKAVVAVVEQSPYLFDVRASVGMTGRVKIYARQRKPILRVYCGNECLYVDETGVTMPYSSQGVADVTVASGHFAQRLAKGHGAVNLAEWQDDSVRSQYTLAQLWKLADYLYHDHNRLAEYDHIFIDDKGNFCLVPSWADFTVVMGPPDQMKEKMRHLDRFVERVLPVKGWDAYSEVNLKYKRQIVCRKRDENK